MNAGIAAETARIETAPKDAPTSLRGLTHTDRLNRSEGSMQPTLPSEYAAKFWSKVDKSGSCWLWIDRLSDSGYGVFFTGKRDFVAHRLAYWSLRGPIPEGMVLDHICRVRKCVNPDHLRVVTSRENTMAGVGSSAINARKTHCIRGHELSGDNLYVKPSKPSDRECIACRTRTVPCDACGSVVRAWNLRRHLREVHGREADR